MENWIHPQAIIEDGTTLGKGLRIGAGAIVKTGAIIGDNVTISEYAIIGGDPQDLGFDPATPSGVTIGAGATIREGATVHRSTKVGGLTLIGPGAWLMANSHAAHDTVIGERTILANGVLLGGHVAIGPHCFLGGNAVVHQHTRVGEGAILQGLAGISHDAPPFTIAAGVNRLAGLNLIGLRRRGFPGDVIADLKACYHAVYRKPGNPVPLAAAHPAQTDEGRRFLAFFITGRKGYLQPRAHRVST